MTWETLNPKQWPGLGKWQKVLSRIDIAWFYVSLLIIMCSQKCLFPFLSYSSISHAVWTSLSPESHPWELSLPTVEWSASAMLTLVQLKVSSVASTTKLRVLQRQKFCVILCYTSNTLLAHCWNKIGTNESLNKTHIGWIKMNCRLKMYRAVKREDAGVIPPCY